MQPIESSARIWPASARVSKQALSEGGQWDWSALVAGSKRMDASFTKNFKTVIKMG